MDNHRKYGNCDEELEVFIKASESLLTLQTYCLKRIEALVKRCNLDADEMYSQYDRTRRGNTITIFQYRRGDKNDKLEWYTIKRVAII